MDLPINNMLISLLLDVKPEVSFWPFVVVSFITILSALYVVTSRNPVYSVLALIVTFLSISVHYVLLNAQFLAIVNIIVYAGAIMVLFLFVLMMLNLKKETEPVKHITWGIVAAVAGILLLFVLVMALVSVETYVQPGTDRNVGLIKNLGQMLFTEYLVPFELTGILFLSAMVGAVYLGKRDTKEVAE
jgi:NADH-quinone oxidoreductase subunit J